jgi:hypothetical protein
MVLMNEQEAPGGHISLPEHNLRITRTFERNWKGTTEVRQRWKVF